VTELKDMVMNELRKHGRMLQCPSCDCQGHVNTFDGTVEFYMPGRPTAIHDCAFCDQVICTCCYLQHIANTHPERYSLKTDSSSSSSNRRERAKRSARSRS